MVLTGYDADEGRRYYVDKTDGSTWVGAPYAEYGVLMRLTQGTGAKENKSAVNTVRHQSN